MSKTRSTVLIALLVAVALSAGLLLGISGRAKGGATEPAAAGSVAATTTQPAAVPASATQPETVVIVQPAAQPQPAPQPAPQPQPEPQPKPNPGVLAVGPSVIELPANQWAAKFVIANIGGSDLAWFAVGVPSTVSLSATKGVLKPGEDVTIGATVDHTKLAKGDFSLTLHVSANDTAQSVTIKGTKTIKPIGPVGPGNLTAKD